jgi:hypothetical protein
VIYVPSKDITTIQQALDIATTGSVVIVAPGTYFENINFHGVDFVLRSYAPLNPSIVAQTVIDGGATTSVITLGGSETAACVIEGFTIRNGAAKFGGGIRGLGSNATIQCNMIVDNFSNEDNGFGGGLAACNGLIQNNVIAFNATTGSNSDGGGLYFCNGTIRNNTIYGNSAQHATSRGGGLANCHGFFLNNIIYANVARGVTDQEAQLYSSSLSFFSVVQGWADDFVPGIISADPQLANPNARDFHLRSGSPCIDAGVAAMAGLPPLSVDFEGTRRPTVMRFPSFGDHVAFDIGADEYAESAVGSIWLKYE